MAAAPASPRQTNSIPGALALEPIWRGPLVPVALAATAGILLDRWFVLPLLWTISSASLAIAASLLCTWKRRPLPSLMLLWCAVGSLGGAYHHWQREIYPADDIGQFAGEEPRPVLLRGVLDTEPLFIKRAGQDDLRSFPANDSGRIVLQVTALKQQDEWQSISGRLQVHTAVPTGDVHVGDEVEVAGRLQAPGPPENPGEFDYASALRDQRIRALLSVRDSGDSFRMIRQGGGGLQLTRTLARLRAWAQDVLMDYIPPERQGVAIALLLGDGAPMTQEDWDKYIRTGVIHVLAISGQHLVVLAMFLGIGLQLFRVRRRPAVIATAVLLLGYALLVGGRPPVMRSAAAICAISGGVLLNRPLVRANTFALAWLIVAVLNPTDICTVGCQLSFLSVAVLTWGIQGWVTSDPDAVDQLKAESRPVWLQCLLWLGRHVWVSYAITLAIWIVVAPLIAARLNVVSLAGLAIGPPTVLLTSVALLSGFALLLLAPICPPLAQVAAWITQLSLAGCDELVRWAAAWPGGCWYVPQVPGWWLWTFYLGVLGLIMLPTLRRVWTWCVLALLVLMTVGLTSGAARPRTGELRCAFLAVGHGGCAVLETPDGQTFLYDVGSLSGPEIVRGQVAPYLWHRGIRRIDEVFLSHADLDHFNGLAALLERFAVGQVSCTPTFQQRPTPAVKRTLRELQTYGIAIRVLHAGQQLRAGDVEIGVLHPPPVGPEGNENSRSLVLLIRHAGHAIMLTGDLEGAGLERVTSETSPHVDALMCPHHGNKAATAAMIQWAQPRVAISCQGPPRQWTKKDSEATSVPPLLGTWPHGTVTVRSRADWLMVETYVSKQRLRLQ